VPLTRSLWLWLAVALAAAAGVLALSAGREAGTARESHVRTPTAPFAGTDLASAELPGAAITLARRSPSFGTQAKRALKKADKALAHDSAAAQSALNAWTADDSSSAEDVIGAIDRLRSDVGKLRRTIVKLKPRAGKDKRARAYLTGSLAQTDKGLRGLSSLLVLDDPVNATDLQAPALKAFAKADALAAKANKALGCKQPCSRVL
jgi:hypothetical protein